MGRLGSVVLVACLTVAGTVGWPAAPAPAPQTRALALVGARVRTQTDAGDFVGTVLIRDGRIAELGPKVDVPPDARRLDLTGHVITPGLIDAHGSLWLNHAAAQESGRDAGLNILDAVDPFAEDWPDAAAQGVTAVYVQPASSGLLGGRGAVLRVGPAETVEELTIKAPAGVQAALGAAPVVRTPVDQPTRFRGRGGLPDLTPPADETPAPSTSNSLTRYGQYEQLRGQLEAAKKYGDSKPSKRDATKELLLHVVKGELPLHLEVNHEDDLRNALKLTHDLKLRTVLERVDRARVLPEELRTGRAPLVLGPFYPPARRDAAELRRLARDGRRWAIGTFGDEPRATATLRLHAAAAVAAGYPREQVLRALTRGAAELLGVADTLGSLAPGRVADLAVFAGDPLDPSVPVRLAVSQGKVVHEQPAAEPAPPRVSVRSPSLPERLPANYIIKSNRMLNAAGELVPGEFYVENGRVTTRGDSSWVVPTFDLGDAVVTPGLVAAHHAFGAVDTTDADAAYLRACDGLDPNDPAFRAYRDQGFLTVVIAPGPGNVLAGQACVVRAGDRGLPVEADVGPKLVLTAAARHVERYPASLAGQFELLDGRLRGEESKTDLYLPPAVRARLLAQRSAGLEAARAGKQVALIEAHTRAEVRAALRLITDHKLRGVLIGPQLADELVSEIRQAGAGVIATPPRPQDPETHRRALAALGKAGVPIAFGSGSAAELRAAAACLVQAGLPRPAARRGLTAEAAALLHLPAGTARLTAGDPADFVVWDGCPLDLGSRPLAVVANGQRPRGY